jgi:F0F1-type ATP synthase membrane subunit c/vacuolar-type H+-ATPase subunit K
MVQALSAAWSFSIALIVIFGIVFPALATGLIAFAVAQAIAERRENFERRQGHAKETF